MKPCCDDQYDSARLNMTELERGMSALRVAFEEAQTENAELAAELERAKDPTIDASSDSKHDLLGKVC